MQEQWSAMRQWPQQLLLSEATVNEVADIEEQILAHLNPIATFYNQSKSSRLAKILSLEVVCLDKEAQSRWSEVSRIDQRARLNHSNRESNQPIVNPRSKEPL